MLALGAALMGLGRVEVFMPFLFAGQVLMLLGARRGSLRDLIGVGAAALMISAGLVFMGSAEVLFGGMGRYFVVIAIGTLLYLASWLIDRWAAPRLPAWAAALVFPAARVPIEVAGALGGPSGVWGSFAAPAAGLWPISGLVAIGGFSLLSFALLWLASSVAGFWQDVVDQRRAGAARRNLLPPALVFLVLNLVLAIGATLTQRGATVRVGAVAAPQLTDAYLPSWLVAYGTGALGPADIDRLRPSLTQSLLKTLRRVNQAADRGARIVYTGEGDVKVLDRDLPKMEALAAKTARDRHLWLGIGVHEYRKGRLPLANMILLFSPDGRRVSTYEKTHPIGAETHLMLVGNGRPGTYQTPLAKITSVICYDTEFVAYSRKVAREGADILFAPSSDWPAIATIRGAIARFQALQTGMSLVRPTHDGVSEIVTPDGRVPAEARYDPRNGIVLVADVPAKGKITPYARLGDWPGPLALALLFVLCGWAAYRPSGEPEAFERVAMSWGE